MRRRRTPLAVAAALVIPMAIFAAPNALAADGPYTIDGDVIDSNGDPLEADALLLEDEFGNVKELGPLNSNTTKIGVIHDDDVPTLGKTNPNGQVDLRNAWLDVQRSGDDDWLYFAWERDSNKGSGYIAYEFMAEEAPTACEYDGTEADLIASCNPWENRQAGDFIIFWDQQGGSRELTVRIWQNSPEGLILVDFTLNPEYYEAQYSDDGFFGEAAVNLTQTVFDGEQKCVVFANTIPSTVTGNSDTADYKDTILEQVEPISNCVASIVTTPKAADGTTDLTSVSIGTGVVEVKDSALVGLTGGEATPAGSVSFWLCKVNPTAVPEDLCDSTDSTYTSVGSTALTGASYPQTVVSPSAFVTQVGKYCWKATFSGDSANGIGGATDNSNKECFVVTPATPTLTTEASAGGTLGKSISDDADLSGTATQPTTDIIETTAPAAGSLTPAGGKITFVLVETATCDWENNPVTTLENTSISGDDIYSSGSYQPTSPGDYSWVAFYESDDSGNTSDAEHNTACTDNKEKVSLTTVPSSLTSSQSWVPNDSVTVSATAGGNLTGTVYFELYASSDCGDTGGDSSIYDTTVSISNEPSPKTVSTNNITDVVVTKPGGSYSWNVMYDSTNDAQEDIAWTCHETSTLTITDGGTVSSS